MDWVFAEVSGLGEDIVRGEGVQGGQPTRQTPSQDNLCGRELNDWGDECGVAPE